MTDLQSPYGPLAYFLDLHPDLGDFRTDLITGLSRPQKSISPKYFYDDYGSQLFHQITRLEDYYPTRTEKELFLEKADDITSAIPARAGIFEYGAGSAEKVAWLARGIDAHLYVALDISKDHLLKSANSLSDELEMPVAAVCADFTAPITLPDHEDNDAQRWLGYMPGSTIGNFAPESAVQFLQRASATLGPNAQFLIGIDLEKDIDILNTAYNDSEGLTAAFNLNLLSRIERELGAQLNQDDFEHFAFYNEDEYRIEMHLRARRNTAIELGDERFIFSSGETLHTENSYKYSTARLKSLISPTPWRLTKIWTDPKGWYAACLLSNS